MAGHRHGECPLGETTSGVFCAVFKSAYGRMVRVHSDGTVHRPFRPFSLLTSVGDAGMHPPFAVNPRRQQKA